MDNVFLERFWAKVAKSDGCWEWQASQDNFGYGMIGIGDRKVGRAHRISWELAYGPIPNGLCVLHRCDNPPCVRPDHLFLGTRQDNNADKERKGRGRHDLVTPNLEILWAERRNMTHCSKGHPFDEENTYVFGGSRHCRTCRAESNRRYKQSRRRAA